MSTTKYQIRLFGIPVITVTVKDEPSPDESYSRGMPRHLTPMRHMPEGVTPRRPPIENTKSVADNLDSFSRPKNESSLQGKCPSSFVTEDFTDDSSFWKWFFLKVVKL